MAINFPASPSLNDTFTSGGKTFQWNGTSWTVNQEADISTDTTPTLGGNLDANSQDINNVNNLSLGTGTSISSPAANTLTLGTNSVERLRITSAGQMGLGTNDPNSYGGSVKLAVANTSGTCGLSIVSATNGDGNLYYADGTSGDATYRGYIRYNHTLDQFRIGVAGAEILRIDSTGRIGINANTFNDAAEALRVQAPSGQSNTHLTIMAGSTSGYSVLNFGDDDFNEGRIKYSHSNNDMGFFVNDTERMRLSGNGEHMVYSQGTVSALRTAASSSGSAEILYCTRNSSSVTVGTGVYAIYSNGSASSLSDQTQKKNIETTRDGYLEDLNRLRVVKYNWNDQEDGTPKELGLIAQEVEEVFPGLISDMRSDVGIGTTASTKGVKTSVLPYMLLKALQEANAEIVALKARVNTLEGS